MVFVIFTEIFIYRKFVCGIFSFEKFRLVSAIFTDFERDLHLNA